ncbi:hypothetical protein C8Q77DRAFT_1070688 [Trametes polyzona]|nr:hypothetical protein C8Q77DRAFT_1070688 [Trametes polyzona]
MGMCSPFFKQLAAQPAYLLPSTEELPALIMETSPTVLKQLLYLLYQGISSRIGPPKLGMQQGNPGTVAGCPTRLISGSFGAYYTCSRVDRPYEDSVATKTRARSYGT